MTNLLEPYKRNPAETPITTLTHILHCYDRTYKLLQTLDLDSQNEILLPYSFRTSPLLFLRILQDIIAMAPNAEAEDIINMTSSRSKAHSLKAAIFHTMAYKFSLEINNNKITPKSLIAYLKILYNVAQIKKKRITFEQYSRIHVAGPKIAICETTSNVVFVLNSAFTSKDHYFHAAVHEATDAFNNMLQDFGYTQKLEIYDPHQHQAHPPQKHPLYN